VGTKYALQTEDVILFIEDTGEAPYKIDRMLTQMRNGGSFDMVRGVVFGAMSKCVDPYNDLRDIIRDLFSSSPFPVAFGLNSGHGELNISLRLGYYVELDSRNNTFILKPG
jgi:muramoyltetrapeptide carboxypeptidase